MYALHFASPSPPSSLTNVHRLIGCQVTSDLRSSDEVDETAGSITHSRFVWFTSNFVHLPPHKPLVLRDKGMSRIQLSSNFLSENFICQQNFIWRKAWGFTRKRHTKASHNYTWTTDRSGTTPQYNFCFRPWQETLWWLGQRVVNISVSQWFAVRKMIVHWRPDSSWCERKFTITTKRNNRPNRRQPVRHSNELCQSATGKVKLSR